MSTGGTPSNHAIPYFMGISFLETAWLQEVRLVSDQPSGGRWPTGRTMVTTTE
jgi:hypothetical protein